MEVFNPTGKTLTSSGLDAQLEIARNKLSSITWLDRNLGRAFLLSEKGQGDTIIKVPKVYTGEAEYFNVMPNDALKSFSFFIGRGADVSIQDIVNAFQKPRKFQKEVSLIVFGDFKKIDNSRDDYFIEELKTDVIDALTNSPSIIINEVFTETIEEVYEGFALNEIDRDLLYYPFFAMRFSLSVTYIHSKC